MLDTEALVRNMLALAGLTPPEDEIDVLVARYGEIREQLSSLYAVTDTPLTDGVLVFRATE